MLYFSTHIFDGIYKTITYNINEGDYMYDETIQLVLHLSKKENDLIMELAEETKLPVSELIVLSVLALRLPTNIIGYYNPSPLEFGDTL